MKKDTHFSSRLWTITGCVFCLSLANSVAASDPELPSQLSFSRSSDARINLSWPSVVGQKYRVEQSSDLGSSSWTALTGDIEANDQIMTYQSTGEVLDDRMFFRLAVQGDNFDPASLQPLWQLDAQKDFPAEAEGKAVSAWVGTGATAAQTVAAQQPVLQNGAVVFDGTDDILSIPMWSQGVGTEWTMAVLMKVRKNIRDNSIPFGGDFSASRTLEVSYISAGLYRWTPNWDILVNQEDYAFAANDDWKILILRSDGTKTKIQLDWDQTTASSLSAITGATGNFNLGGSFSTTTAAAVNFRYLSFIPRCITDDETAKLTRWLERKKNGEYPPVMLIYGGGQSNFLATNKNFARR